MGFYIILDSGTSSEFLDVLLERFPDMKDIHITISHSPDFGRGGLSSPTLHNLTSARVDDLNYTYIFYRPSSCGKGCKVICSMLRSGKVESLQVHDDMYTRYCDHIFSEICDIRSLSSLGIYQSSHTPALIRNNPNLSDLVLISNTQNILPHGVYLDSEICNEISSSGTIENLGLGCSYIVNKELLAAIHMNMSLHSFAVGVSVLRQRSTEECETIKHIQEKCEINKHNALLKGTSLFEMMSKSLEEIFFLPLEILEF